MLKSPIDMTKAAWQTFTKRWKFFVLLTIAAMIIPGIVFFIGGAIAAAAGIGAAVGGSRMGLVFIVGLVMLVAYLAAIYISIVFYAGLMMAVADEQINTVRDAFNRAKPKAKDLFVVALLVSIIVAIASLFLLIPGIYLAICYSFAAWMCLLEGKKGMDALKASKDLVAGRWLAVFGRLIAFVLIIWICVAVPQAVFALIRMPFLAGLWSIATALAITPVAGIYSYMFYQNLKQTKVSAPATPVAPMQA